MADHPFDLTTARRVLTELREAKSDAERAEAFTDIAIALGDIVEAVETATSPAFPSNIFTAPSRVELVGFRRPNRPGTLARFERVLTVHERMIVAFDDGETCAINPDVMRTIR